MCHDISFPYLHHAFSFFLFVCELHGRNKESTRIGASLTVVRDPVQTPFVYKDMPEQYFFFIRVFSRTSVPGNNIIPRFVLTSFFLFFFFRETWFAFPSLRHSAYIMCIRNFCPQLCLTFVVTLISYVLLLFFLVHPAVLECRGYQLQCQQRTRLRASHDTSEIKQQISTSQKTWLSFNATTTDSYCLHCLKKLWPYHRAVDSHPRSSRRTKWTRSVLKKFAVVIGRKLGCLPCDMGHPCCFIYEVLF